MSTQRALTRAGVMMALVALSTGCCGRPCWRCGPMTNVYAQPAPVAAPVMAAPVSVPSSGCSSCFSSPAPAGGIPVSSGYPGLPAGAIPVGAPMSYPAGGAPVFSGAPAPLAPPPSVMKSTDTPMPPPGGASK